VTGAGGGPPAPRAPMNRGEAAPPPDKCARSLACRLPAKSAVTRHAAPSVLPRTSPIRYPVSSSGCAATRFSRSARRVPVCAPVLPAPHNRPATKRRGAAPVRAVLAATLAVAFFSLYHPRPSAYALPGSPKKKTVAHAPCKKPPHHSHPHAGPPAGADEAMRPQAAPRPQRKQRGPLSSTMPGWRGNPPQIAPLIHRDTNRHKCPFSS
jgi:hypothetical protein